MENMKTVKQILIGNELRYKNEIRILNISNFREMNRFHLLDSDKEGKEKLEFLGKSEEFKFEYGSVVLGNESLAQTPCV